MKKLFYISIFFSFFACKDDVDVEPTTLLDVPETPFFGNYTIPDNNSMKSETIKLGRMLFYEKKLSGDNTMSCASCHKQEFAFTDGEVTSEGIDGISGTRNTMSIQNLLWDDFFFWNGRSPSLEDQALKPITNPIELHQSLADAVKKLEDDEEYPTLFKDAFGSKEITSEKIGKAIAQFERTLISANSKYDKYLRGEVNLTDSELSGLQLMSHPTPGVLRGGNCGDCHMGYTFSNREMKNNGSDPNNVDIGLEEKTGLASDKGKFKVPTLRNIALTAPYMHDGRFATLEEVLDHYNDTSLFSHNNVDFQIKEASNEFGGTSLLLTEQEKKDIIAFLHTLTDTTFTTNECFSDPF